MKSSFFSLSIRDDLRHNRKILLLSTISTLGCSRLVRAESWHDGQECRMVHFVVIENVQIAPAENALRSTHKNWTPYYPGQPQSYNDSVQLEMRFGTHCK